MTGPYRGSCLCGVVRFAADEFLPTVAHCHCSMCRKFHGAAFATLGGVPRSGFRWIEGRDALRDYVADNGTTRTFCGHCGSSLAFASPWAPDDVIEIAMGAFDDAVPVVPNAHIFVASAANWTAFGDEVPRYAEGRDSNRLNGKPGMSS